MPPLPTLLCTVTFPANTGFAWDFIEGLYARMANDLTRIGVRTMVAYPEIWQPPKTLEGSHAVPVLLDTTMGTWKKRFSMARFVRRENVQVLYLTDRPLWSVWYPLLRWAGVRKIIVHDHTSGTRTVPTGMWRLIKRIFIRLPGIAADTVVAVSDYVADRDAAVALIPRRKIRRIWNGIDTPDPERNNQSPDLREVLGVPPGTVVIACACRATPEKGVDVLFQSFDRLGGEFGLPVLAYIGGGPAFEDLVALKRGLISGDRIFLPGYLPRAADLLRTADICVVPSIWEDAFPLSVLETMARGRAVVGTRVGGVPEMIEDGVSGLLVPPRNVTALRDALAKLLADSSLREALGSAARDRASTIFSADRQISEMLSTFQNVFSG